MTGPCVWWVWLTLMLTLYSTTNVKASEACPPGCYCDAVKTEKRSSPTPPGGVGLKINCHPLSSGSFNLSLLPANTISLDMAKYGLRTLPVDAFASAPFLQKLDLQNNDLSVIDDGVFRSLGQLEVLDLSLNRLDRVSRNMFQGLARLERLKLNDNRLQTIEEGSFDMMPNLTRLELAENSFVCNCSFSWFVDWLSSRPNVLANGPKTKCALPISLADQPIKKAPKEEFTCGREDVFRHVGSFFQLEPAEHQVVFEGDPLKLVCRVQASSATHKVLWLMKGRPIDSINGDGVLVSSTLLPGDVVEASVFIPSLKASFSGDWTCQTGLSDDASTSLKSSLMLPVHQKSINVLVMTQETKLCSPHVTNTARGTFRWGVAVGGHTAQQACPSSSSSTTNYRQSSQSRSFGFAYLLCRTTGDWSDVVNASQCAYTSSTTETLAKFANFNLTDYETGTLFQSAKHFVTFTENPEVFHDPLDVIYFSKAVENYLPHLRRNADVGHSMLDMISKALAIDRELVSRAQAQGLAAKHLVDLVENVTSILPTFQHHDNAITVETRPIKPLHFEGVACTWSSSAAAVSSPSTSLRADYSWLSAKRVFHCAQGNKTLPSQGKRILANLVIPPNLHQQISGHSGGLLLSSTTSLPQLTFVVFANATLFPSPVDASSTFYPVSGPVVGGLVVGLPVFNLSDPVNVALWSSENLDTLEPGLVQPVWWNPLGKGGFGEWTPEVCKLISARSNLVWFTCSRLGYYGYRITRSAAAGSNQDSGSSHRGHHPLTYVGVAVAIGLMVFSVMTYVTCYASLNISRQLKHGLPNLWSALICLCFMYVTGIYQTQHKLICRTVGITIHYLTLSCLLWLLVCTHIIYSKVTKQRRHLLRHAYETTNQQNDVSKRHRRPILRFYLFGWGVSAIFVAITASINVDYYATNRHCFLKLAPFLGGLIVPAAILLSVLLGFALSAYCVLSTAPSHVTEQIEVNVFRGGHGGRSAGGGRGVSLLSVATLLMPDEEKSSKSLLHSLALVFFLFFTAWSVAGLSVTYAASNVEQESFPLQDFFDISFGIIVAIFAFYIFVFHCVMRQDVRHCWRHPVCLASSSVGLRDRCHYDEDEQDELLETSNHVNLYPNPALIGQPETGFMHHQISDNLPPPGSFHNYNSYAGIQFNAIGDVQSHQHYQMKQVQPPLIGRGTVAVESHAALVRQKPLEGDASSDHLNNVNHLRRGGYAAPVNSAGASDADYTMLPPPNLFHQVGGKHHPTTSSPSGNALPQFFDMSPLVPTSTAAACGVDAGANLMTGVDSLDSRLENVYSESCTIKVGHPCQLASITAADFPSHLAPKSNKKLQQHLTSQRHSRAAQQRHKTSSRKDDFDRASVDGGSTVYSSKSNKRRHKRPNRRRPRPQAGAQSIANGNSKRSDDGQSADDADYLGDDDPVDTVDDEDEVLDADAREDEHVEPDDEIAKDGPEVETSQLIHDFNAAELKRETSV